MFLVAEGGCVGLLLVGFLVGEVGKAFTDNAGHVVGFEVGEVMGKGATDFR